MLWIPKDPPFATKTIKEIERCVSDWEIFRLKMVSNGCRFAISSHIEATLRAHINRCFLEDKQHLAWFIDICVPDKSVAKSVHLSFEKGEITVDGNTYIIGVEWEDEQG